MISIKDFLKFEEMIRKIVQEENKGILERISHLPTKKEYYDREEKTIAELQKMREAVVLAVNQREKIEDLEDRV